MVQGCKLDGRILGVDPGTLLMGFGIIDQFQNNLYAPTKVKSLVTGFGRSTKGEIADMVGILLKINNLKNSLDATDALAVAICHSSVKKADAAFTQ